MREGWEQVRLGDLITKRKDFTPVDPDTEYVILGVQRSGWGFVERDPLLGSEQKFAKLMRIEEDDLVYRTITAFEAPSAVAGPDEAGHFVTPQTFPVFRIDQTRMLAGFASLLTTWPGFHEEMATRCTGTVLRRKTLSVGAFESIPVALPPLDEQRRIVDLIGALDDAIEAAMVALDEARNLTDTRLRAIFHDPEETIGFGEVATFASGAGFPTDEQGDLDGDIPFIKVSDMNLPGNETHIVTANNHVTTEGLRRLKARAWPAGTIVFPKVGAALLTEKRRMLTSPTAFDNNVMGVIAREDVVTPAFLFSYMRTVTLGDYAQIGAVPSINQSHLRALSLPAIPLAQQASLDAEVSAFDGTVAACGITVDRLHDLRSNLLTALLSGEHEIPESYDELMEV